MGEIRSLVRSFMHTPPMLLDLCCGLGGWADGFIAEGWGVVGVDVAERFRASYPGYFIGADVTRLRLRDLPGSFALVVASPPCQEFSRHQMPWTRRRTPAPPDLSIWRACERIAAELAAPLIVENVCAAQRWMGAARWHCGPYYLWGDVPALMPGLGETFGERQKQSRSSEAAAERAKIPLHLAQHIARMMRP